MSSGPTEIGETLIKVTKKGRINIKLEKKDWCMYKGECDHELTVSKQCICWYCTWMQKFDIPEMIKTKRGE